MVSQPAKDSPSAMAIAATKPGTDVPSPAPGLAPASAPMPAPDDPSDLKPDFAEGGLTAWLQVAASFALYFNHLYAPFPPCLTPPY